MRKILTTQIENFVYRKNMIQYENKNESENPKDKKTNFVVDEMMKSLYGLMNNSYLLKSTYDGDCYTLRKQDLSNFIFKTNLSMSQAFLKEYKGKEYKYQKKINKINKNSKENLKIRNAMFKTKQEPCQ